MAKHVIKDRVQNWDNKIFTVEKLARGEEGIVVQFSRPVKYRVVKLSTRGLPSRDKNGRKITWCFNIGVVDARGHYVPRVKYTVFVPAPHKRVNWIYYIDGDLVRGKPPKPRGFKPPQPGMIQMEFRTGDPAAGWT